jgi:hypothetical protein
MTDVFAYAVTGNDLFGVVDLTTGVFTERGDMGLRLNGLTVGPGGVLYGGGPSYSSPTFYSIDPTNGALTLVGNSFSAGFYDLGSTTTGIFAVGNDGNLYSINPNTGAATLIGPTIKGNGMSSGGSTLYMTDGSTNDRALATSNPFRVHSECTFRNASIDGGEPPLWVRCGCLSGGSRTSGSPRQQTHRCAAANWRFGPRLCENAHV